MISSINTIRMQKTKSIKHFKLSEYSYIFLNENVIYSDFHYYNYLNSHT